jgi:phosphatidylethanolamine-binding protein (PEBP) family uncharacterized protein
VVSIILADRSVHCCRSRFHCPYIFLTIAPCTSPRKEAQLADTGGRNDSVEIGYTGNCLPPGRHRYFARLYALREKLNLPAGANATEVQNALDGKVIEQARHMARHQKSAKGKFA